MKIYRLNSSENGRRLKKSEEQPPQLGPRDVLVRIVAASLNYRDLMVLRGQYGADPRRSGTALRRRRHCRGGWQGSYTLARRRSRRANFFRAGSKVRFASPTVPPLSVAVTLDGVLSELVVVPEASLVPYPMHSDFGGGCNFAMRRAHSLASSRGARETTPGDTVLVQGTGGVALFSLQIATALGARVIVISSSDEKRERAAHFGAWATINYRQRPIGTLKSAN